MHAYDTAPQCLPFQVPFPAQCDARIHPSMLASPWQQPLEVLHSPLQQHASQLPTCPAMLQNHSWMQQDLVQTFVDMQPNKMNSYISHHPMLIIVSHIPQYWIEPLLQLIHSQPCVHLPAAFHEIR